MKKLSSEVDSVFIAAVASIYQNIYGEDPFEWGGYSLNEKIRGLFFGAICGEYDRQQIINVLNLEFSKSDIKVSVSHFGFSKVKSDDIKPEKYVSEENKTIYLVLEAVQDDISYYFQYSGVHTSYGEEWCDAPTAVQPKMIHAIIFESV